MSADGWLGLLLAGVFAGSGGWFLRRLLVEATAAKSPAERDLSLSAELGNVRGALTRAEQRAIDAERDAQEHEARAKELEESLVRSAKRLGELEERASAATLSPPPAEDAGEPRTSREGIRKLESERRAAENAHEAVSRLLAESQRQLASCEAELEALRAKVPVLISRAAASTHVAVLNEAVSREKEAEIQALDAHVRRLEEYPGKLRALELRSEARLKEQSAELDVLRSRLKELDAPGVAPKPFGSARVKT